MPDLNALAPGARVEVRHAEWIVKRVDATSTGGRSILVEGLSELVRGKEARFLTEIEGEGIQVIDPAETRLVHDESPQYRDTLLLIESLLRLSPPVGEDLHVGHLAAIDDLPFQLDPAIQALQQPRHRILMADAVGLGKTIEVGVLLSELIRRGKAKRILAITTRAMMTQFQKELWNRFTIPLVRLDSDGIQRVRAHLPTMANPFHYFDKAIVSVDTLKQDAEYRVALEHAWWDVIVIDEAQNVAERGSRLSLRARLAARLASRSDTLIMTSATPHDGRAESFASLMNMLDPTAIADPSHYGKDDIKGLFLRRFKKDVWQQVGASLKERRVWKRLVDASPSEEEAFDLLTATSFKSFDRRRTGGHLLFKTVLEKSLFSSPAAALQSIRERLRKLEKDVSPEAAADRASLGALEESVRAIATKDFTKYQELLRLLHSDADWKWTGKDPKDRLVIFTERIETLRFLEENLKRDLGLKDAQVACLHGQGTSDINLQEVVEAFGRDKEPVRLLIASDIAAEGLNLHYLCHRMIHFDLPWSLMVFQQRNGRIDRYGQEREPRIAYLLTQSANPKIRGDQRILELLQQKDEQAQKNIADPSAFFGVYEEQAEEGVVGDAIERGLTSQEFEKEMQAKAGTDFLSQLLEELPMPDGSAAAARKRHMPSLFQGDFEFLHQGLEHIRKRTSVDVEFDKERACVTITLNDEIRRTLRALPTEAIPDDGRIRLCADRARVKKAIEDCRSEERSWPSLHLLWDLHPVMQWLLQKLLVAFGRREAPVMTLPEPNARDEAYVLIQGEIPNRKGHPVVHDWFAVRFERGRMKGIVPLEEFLRKTGLAARAFPNRGARADVIRLEGLLPEAIRAARDWMKRLRLEFEKRVGFRLEAERKRLALLKARQVVQLEVQFPATEDLKGVRMQKKCDEQRRIDRRFNDWTAWVEETMTVEDKPYLRVVAVFTGGE